MSIIEEIRKRTIRDPVLEKKDPAGKLTIETEEDILKIAKDVDLDIEGIDMAEILSGCDVELEHGTRGKPDTNITGDDPGATLKIAIAHLREIPDYYTRLARMEREGKEALKKNETDS